MSKMLVPDERTHVSRAMPGAQVSSAAPQRPFAAVSSRGPRATSRGRAALPFSSKTTSNGASPASVSLRNTETAPPTNGQRISAGLGPPPSSSTVASVEAGASTPQRTRPSGRPSASSITHACPSPASSQTRPGSPSVRRDEVRPIVRGSAVRLRWSASSSRSGSSASTSSSVDASVSRTEVCSKSRPSRWRGKKPEPRAVSSSAAAAWSEGSSVRSHVERSTSPAAPAQRKGQSELPSSSEPSGGAPSSAKRGSRRTAFTYATRSTRSSRVPLRGGSRPAMQTARSVRA